MPEHEALARVIAQAAGEHDPGFEPWHYEEAAVVIAAAVVEFLTSDEAGLCAECVEKVRAL